ncbi:MAG: N-methyl-L-tryptophan oxidase [Ferruginibacter sp.]
MKRSEFETANEKVKQLIHRANDNDQTNFDVIVLGVGSMGSSACYYLAKQGIKVLGLEQFDIPNEMSSHAGQSRIIRKAYFEHSDYVPLLERSYQNWKQLENMTGTQVYFQTGLLYFGKPDHPMMKGVNESADKYNIKLDRLSATDTAAKFPQIKIADDYEKLYEPGAGFITPERAILLYTENALQNGAVIKIKVKVLDWSKTKDGVQVTTTAGNYFAKKLIITAGPWAGKMIPGILSTLRITRQVVAWVIPKNISSFELGNLPCWLIADDERPGAYYGFPVLPADRFYGPTGFKIAHHYPGAVSDPDTISRVPTPADEANLVYALNRFFPEGYRSTQVMKTCMYSNTPDENFILDFLPGYDKDVVIATGFSGHGFKFASVVGEIMSDLATKGNTSLPIGFLNASRF